MIAIFSARTKNFRRLKDKLEWYLFVPDSGKTLTVRVTGLAGSGEDMEDIRDCLLKYYSFATFDAYPESDRLSRRKTAYHYYRRTGNMDSAKYERLVCRTQIEGNEIRFTRSRADIALRMVPDLFILMTPEGNPENIRKFKAFEKRYAKALEEE